MTRPSRTPMEPAAWALLGGFHHLTLSCGSPVARRTARHT